MKMNDTNAAPRRRAPRFNAIDALIVILVIVAVLGIYFRYNILDYLSAKQNANEYYVSFSINNIRHTTPNYIRIDDKFYLDSSDRYLGTLVSESENQRALNITPASEYFTDRNGQYVEVAYPNEDTRVNARGRLLCTGTYHEEGGFCLDGTVYLTPGQTVTVYSEAVTVDIVILSVELVEES